MQGKWPLVIITSIMLIGLGLTIASLEKQAVISNWSKRRCNLPVMATASYFKPKEDSRTPSQFASDNFEFCTKQISENIVNLILSPLQAIFGKHMNLATDASQMVNTMRSIAKTLYDSFLSYLDPYFTRFVEGVYEMSRITQYLRMAMRRVQAVMLSTVWTGLTLVRTIMNSVSFVIKVVMVILGILVALLIILIFVLFPFIPLILSVIGAIMAVAVGSTLGEAASFQSSFCFADDTKILVKKYENNEWKEEIINVSLVKVGDLLGKNCGKVTAVIQMDGSGVELYNLDGIYVSGSHTVYGSDNKWKLVEQDERATKTNKKTPILYCFNTESHNIPVIGENKLILFRDWEELSDSDVKGQMLWNYHILSRLNKYSNYYTWKKDITKNTDIPIISNNTKVATKNGNIPIKEIKLHDRVMSAKGYETYVIGIVDGIIDNSVNPDNGNNTYRKYTTSLLLPQNTNNEKPWHTELIYFDNSERVWKRMKSTVSDEMRVVDGKTLITESGDFIIVDQDVEDSKKACDYITVRDFTDVGYESIQDTYQFVASRLRLEKPIVV